jgi:hypothetical protein
MVIPFQVWATIYKQAKFLDASMQNRIMYAYRNIIFS